MLIVFYLVLNDDLLCKRKYLKFYYYYKKGCDIEILNRSFPSMVVILLKPITCMFDR